MENSKLNQLQEEVDKLKSQVKCLEEQIKKNSVEDDNRWLDEIDDDSALYKKIMKDVAKLIEESK